jgi:flagellar hook protein FlgE
LSLFMRLESALFTSFSGLSSNGQAIAVVGDNVSNANTTAFKTARAEFADLMAAPPGDRASYAVDGAGDGAAVRRVRVIQDSGIVEPTGRTLDAAISGGGFFIVGDATAPQYTRNGTFRIDEGGRLVTADGLAVLGFPGTSNALGELSVSNVQIGGTPTTDLQLFGNLDAGEGVKEPAANPESFGDIGPAANFTSTQNVYDSLGQRHDVMMAFFKTEAGGWTAQAYIDGGDLGQEAGTPVLLGQVEIEFDGTGRIPEANRAAAVINATPAYANGATAGAFAIDFGSMTQFAGGSLLANVTQDGIGAGNVSGYQFDTNGNFFALMDNGTQTLLGTVKLATFRNIDGLERSGSSLFRATPSAGEVTVGNPGDGLLGSLEGGALERSTVDIANEFVNLVTFQRAYQANSQVLGKAGEMLSQTLSLIR